MYLQLSPDGQRSLATKSKCSSGFCDSLDIHQPVSQSTVRRIEDRVLERVPSWADHFDRVKQAVIIQMQGTEYEDWFDDPPQVECVLPAEEAESDVAAATQTARDNLSSFSDFRGDWRESTRTVVRRDGC